MATIKSAFLRRSCGVLVPRPTGFGEIRNNFHDWIVF
jgi:hypothetical protein